MNKANRYNIAVIIPALNEESTIGSLLRKLNRVLEDSLFVVVDGNSRDATVKIAKDFGAEIIYQKGNGKGSALRQAFSSPKLESKFVVMIDADLSMNPEEIPSFIKALESGADVVKGSRFLPKSYSDDLTLTRRIGNKFLTSLVNLIYSTKYSDLCYGFIAFRKDALEKLVEYLDAEKFEIEVDICIRSRQLGLKVVEVPSIESRRLDGVSRLNTVKDGYQILLKILRLAFNTEHKYRVTSSKTTAENEDPPDQPTI